MNDIKVGAIVQLKSGGPEMTIEEVGDFSSIGIRNGAKCIWFDDKNAVQKEFFALGTLMAVEG